MIKHALTEGMNKEDFKDLPIPIESMDDIQAVPADHFFALHEMLDQRLGPGFSVRVGRQMKIEDYGVLGLSWRTCSKAGEIFERCERYFHLLSNTYLFKVEKEGEVSKVYLFREVLGKEENQVVTNDVEKVLGRKATSFKEYVQETAQRGVWNQSIPQSI